MTVILVDKQLFPLELLDIGPCMFVQKQGHIQVEKLPGEADGSQPARD